MNFAYKLAAVARIARGLGRSFGTRQCFGFTSLFIMITRLKAATAGIALDPTSATAVAPATI